ncbi:MAG: winged helix-turn-helix domain-containing protein [Chloroflexota bacterium]|nr:winged helix-turn-helix domain-containing protein [Dehalococcoidia bacterium]MDW8252425.1 winged helix-turn-helix domain-containing protein [Chloroflexota bacterium]
MGHGDVSAAFELLLSELDNALSSAREEAARASRAGRYSEVNASIAVAQQIETIVDQIKASYRQWQEISSQPRASRQDRPSPPQHGRRTPVKVFRLPILRALVALGGSAPLHTVLERVFDEVKGSLTEADFDLVPSQPNTPYWRNYAQWARKELVLEGLMCSDSPRGIWAISEHGVAYLERHQAAAKEKNP